MIGEDMCFKIVSQHSVGTEENHGFLGCDSFVLAEIQNRQCRMQVRNVVILINMLGKFLFSYHFCSDYRYTFL
jgi:hypothetical protein